MWNQHLPWKWEGKNRVSGGSRVHGEEEGEPGGSLAATKDPLELLEAASPSPQQNQTCPQVSSQIESMLLTGPSSPKPEVLPVPKSTASFTTAHLSRYQCQPGWLPKDLSRGV